MNDLVTRTCLDHLADVVDPRVSRLAHTGLFAILLTSMGPGITVGALHLDDLVPIAFLDLLAFTIDERVSGVAYTDLLAVLLAEVPTLVIIVVGAAVVALDLHTLVVSALSRWHALVVHSDQIWLANAGLMADPALIAFNLRQFRVGASLPDLAFSVHLHVVCLADTDLRANSVVVTLSLNLPVLPT